VKDHLEETLDHVVAHERQERRLLLPFVVVLAALLVIWLMFVYYL
jgi:hypothetical protein